jgi:phosphoglycolate phosphatase-like HAD superfamily hydrolase
VAISPDLRLILFDIDGTLISAQGVGRCAIARARLHGGPGCHVPFERLTIIGER